MRRHHVWIALCCAVPRLLAQADDAALKQQFERLDRDGDGAIERKEFAGSDRQFALLDADRDGKATLAEYAASPIARAFLRARYRAAKEPRPRTTADEVAAARLALLARVDKNRDGRVSRAEWSGTDAAFTELDFDGNDVLDRRDLTEAAASAPPAPPQLPEFKRPMPAIDLLFSRFDKDKDDRLTERELRTQKDLVAALEFADADGDQALDRRELQRIADALAQRQNKNVGTRPQPYQVPFDEWDKDDDDKVRQNEWQGPRAVFEQIDLDRDAAVSREEVERYKKRVTGDDFFDRFDLDGNGKVTPEEFAGPPAAFRRMDRNGDGAVTRGDK